MHLITNCVILETTLYNEYGENFYRQSCDFLQVVVITFSESHYEEFFLCDLKSPQNMYKLMKFFLKNFFSKCDQMQKKLRICSYLQKIFNVKLYFLCSDIMANQILSDKLGVYVEPSSTSMMECFSENNSYFCKTLHHRCSTEF